MPLFEYMCIRCGTTFEALVRGGREEEVVCPKCKGARVQKQMSSFAVRGNGGARGAGAPAAACAPGGG